MASKRELVEMELLTSERKYSRDLGIFLDVFIRPLMRHARRNGRNACLTEVEASVLECSLEKISSVTKDLLLQLEQERSGAAQYSKSIGKVFIDESERMRRAYVDFIAGYRAALDLHSDLLERRKKKGAACSYASFMKNCSEANEALVGHLTFADFFILPIQRIPRYRLLLQELLRRVGHRYERAYTKEAIKRVCIIADEMNYRLRKTIEPKKGSALVSRPRLPSSHSSSKVDDDDDEILGTIEEETEADTASAGEHHHINSDTDEHATEEGVSEDDEPLTHASSGLISHKATPATIGSEGNDLHFLEGQDEDPLEVHHGTKEERLDRWLEDRNWQGEDLPSAPTANSFALYAIATKGNPWNGLELSGLNPLSLSTRLESLYFNLSSKGTPEMVPPYRPQEGDVVVCGPLRSGQTPILHALDCFRSGTFPSRNSNAVLDRIGFLQWETWEQDQKLFKARIMKTHQELKAAFGGTLSPALKASRPLWKVIVTLRHPFDLRTSYFRHLRRMFRKLNPELNFDRFAAQDDFADCLITYEQFVADVLKVAVEIESPQLMVVFYEELIADPTKVMQRIADFINFKPEVGNKIAEDRDAFIRKVSLSVTTSPYFIGYSSRAGSCNQGKHHFSKLSSTRMETEWESKIKSKYSQFPSYEKLFCALTGRESYPYDEDESKAGNRGSVRQSRSFTFFSRARQQNATTSTMKETSIHGSEGGRNADSEASEQTAGGGRPPMRRSGSFLGLGRITKAFSVSSGAGGSNERERADSAFSTVEDISDGCGTSKDKAIDPDDSDEEISDELLEFWNREGGST